MAIRKGKLARENFSVISNQAIRDNRVSLKARGLLAYMLSHNEEWQMTTSSIAALNKVGVEQIRSGLRELERFGYVRRERARKPDGTLGGSDWVVGDSPMSENPTLDKPTLENPQLKKTNSKKTNSKKNNSSARQSGDGGSEPLGSGQKPIHQKATEWVYEKTGGAINFKAVMGCIKHSVSCGREPRDVAKACVALYEAGKPITNQTIGQALDGKLYGVEIKRISTPVGEMTLEEANQILGVDNWAPPVPPKEIYGDAKESQAWREKQVAEHQAERIRQAKEVRDGNVQ